MATSVEELSYRLTSDAIAEQERALSGLRARASAVLTAASIAGAFLSAKTSGGSLDSWAVAALIAFVLCLASVVWILLPHKLTFGFRGRALLAESDRVGVRDVNEAYRAVNVWIEPHLEVNREKIEGLSDWLAVSSALLAIEVILWTISVTG